MTVNFRERKFEKMLGQMDLGVFLKDVLKIRKMKTSSNNYLGLCPFHDDQHRSFGVSIHYPHKWGCMSPSCRHGGDLASLVMHKMDITYNEALEVVEKYMGYIKRVSEATLNIPYYEEEDDLTLSEDLLIEYSCGYSTHKYFFKRGLTKDTMYKFRVGYDRYNRRVVVPVFQEGKLINFIGRTVERDVEPKYMIYETVDRETFLFGDHVLPRKIPYLIVYEGLLESLYSHQLGLPNCMSLLGAYVSKKQVERMMRYTDTIVGFLDNDDAGRAAQERLAFFVKRNKGTFLPVRHLSEDKTKFKDLLDYKSPPTIHAMLKVALNKPFVA